MAVVGINIGKSRLAEVVGTAKGLKSQIENAAHVDMQFGVKLSDCQTREQREAVHYDWSNCCDRRLFLIVEEKDIPAIIELGKLSLSQMFDTVVTPSLGEPLAKVLAKSLPKAQVILSPAGTVERVEEVDRLVRGGRPAIAVQCHDRKGLVDVERLEQLLRRAADVEEAAANDEDFIPPVADAATDFAAVGASLTSDT